VFKLKKKLHEEAIKDGGKSAFLSLPWLHLTE